MKITCICISCCLVLFACTRQEEASEDSVASDAVAETASLPEDFLSFYEKFHTDSAYQMDHIIFPLMGLPSYADTLTNPQHYRHKREDWVLHKPFKDPFGEYEREYAMPTESIVIERFVIPRAGFYMERRFAKMNEGEWYLIFYANVNRLPSAQ